MQIISVILSIFAALLSHIVTSLPLMLTDSTTANEMATFSQSARN